MKPAAAVAATINDDVPTASCMGNPHDTGRGT